jgi:hypothetical protein
MVRLTPSLVRALSVGDEILHDGDWHLVVSVEHAELPDVGTGLRPLARFHTNHPLLSGFGYGDTLHCGWPADRVRHSRRLAA